MAADGRYTNKPDVAVVVFGEDPYAEFQGDLPNLLYRPGDDHDLELIRRLRGEGIPVVAVFLSGRPLWLNREINAADAFVAAWLPGSEGAGVADVLLRTRDGRVANDFRGKLAFDWPRTAVAGQGAPQFPLGFGLTYADRASLPELPETSGITGDQIPVGNYVERGKAVHGYAFELVDSHGAAVAGDVSPASTSDGSLRMSALDYKAQEDARRFTWEQGNAQLVIRARTPLDLDRQTNGDVLLVATLRVDARPSQETWIGMGCGQGCQGRVALDAALARLQPEQWVRLGVPLKCFRTAGADMHHIDRPFVLHAGKGDQLAIYRIALGTDVDQVVDCAK
jgi:beta-glucosidase